MQMTALVAQGVAAAALLKQKVRGSIPRVGTISLSPFSSVVLERLHLAEGTGFESRRAHLFAEIVF